jgi:hypothetical protein
VGAFTSIQAALAALDRIMEVMKIPLEGGAAAGAVTPAASAAAPAASPDAPPADLPVYPAAEFLGSYDAGHGQRYYLYGTNAAYDTIVQYYRNTLRTGGREIFKQPLTRQFDLGRFDDDRMSFPPSVVVKDYTWNGSDGYLHVSGTTETRYKTVIQIVPPAETR